MLEYLNKINNFLEGVPLSVTKFFRTAFKSSEELVQSYVDSVCRWAAWRVNISVEWVRQKVIIALWEQYSRYLVLLQAGAIVQKFMQNPLKAIVGFAKEFFKPFKKVREFIKVLYKEIPRLAENLANIMSALPPEPPNPNINFNAFKLNIHTISMKEILLGPAALQPPEKMFPEPPKPWSKETFNASFEDAKETAIAEGPQYKWKDGKWQTGEEKESGVKLSGGTESNGAALA